jgi:hypothetical protein
MTDNDLTRLYRETRQQRDRAVADRTTAEDTLATVKADRDRAERDRSVAQQQRDDARAEVDGLVHDCNKAAADYQDAVRERDQAMTQRDAAVSHLNRVREARDYWKDLVEPAREDAVKARRERDEARTERDLWKAETLERRLATAHLTKDRDEWKAKAQGSTWTVPDAGDPEDTLAAWFDHAEEGPYREGDLLIEVCYPVQDRLAVRVWEAPADGEHDRIRILRRATPEPEPEPTEAERLAAILQEEDEVPGSDAPDTHGTYLGYAQRLMKSGVRIVEQEGDQ